MKQGFDSDQENGPSRGRSLAFPSFSSCRAVVNPTQSTVRRRRTEFSVGTGVHGGQVPVPGTRVRPLELTSQVPGPKFRPCEPR